MATLAGARALGLDGEIGSLRPGKAADFIALDLSAANSQPVYDPASQLAYSGKSSQITDVWVRGKALMEAGRLGWGDEDRILAQAREWGSRIGSSRGEPGGSQGNAVNEEARQPNADAAELERFAAMAAQWWDPNGPNRSAARHEPGSGRVHRRTRRWARWQELPGRRLRRGAPQ